MINVKCRYLKLGRRKLVFADWLSCGTGDTVNTHYLAPKNLDHISAGLLFKAR